jgi:hypothetical protein
MLKKRIIVSIALIGVAAISLGDVSVSGETWKIEGGAPNKITRAGAVTNVFSAADTVDWVAWDSSAVTPSEQKSGGTAFSAFASSQTWTSDDGNRLFMEWTDGDPTLAETSYNALIMDDAGLNTAYTAMTFSVTFDAIAVDEEYKLSLYLTDGRNDSAISYDQGSEFVTASFEDGNDAGDVRVHDVFISGITAETTIDFQITGMRWSTGNTIRLGGMELSVIPEPATAGMFAFMGFGILWVRRQFMI